MWRVLFIVALVTLVAVSCENDRTATGPSSSDLSLTPRENESAELLALFVSEDLVAPGWLYRLFDHDLSAIENVWRDSLEVWDDSAETEWGRDFDIGFEPPWTASRVIVVADSAAHQAILNGTHTEFLKVLTELRGEITHVWIQPNDSSRHHLTLEFRGRLHSCRVAERFYEMTGVLYAIPWHSDQHQPLILPIFNSSRHKYVYMFTWGDCPSGCIFADFYYFEIQKGGYPELLDYARPRYPFEALPAWLDTVCATRNDWLRDHFTWSAGSWAGSGIRRD